MPINDVFGVLFNFGRLLRVPPRKNKKNAATESVYNVSEKQHAKKDKGKKKKGQ